MTPASGAAGQPEDPFRALDPDLDLRAEVGSIERQLAFQEDELLTLKMQVAAVERELEAASAALARLIQECHSAPPLPPGKRPRDAPTSTTSAGSSKSGCKRATASTDESRDPARAGAGPERGASS